MSLNKESQHTGKLILSKNGFDVIECDQCQFKHVLPIPTEQELAQVYQEDYYQTDKPLYLDSFKENKEWWNYYYDSRLQQLTTHLKGTPLEPPYSLIDIGSGPGYFLSRANHLNWKSLGIEPSKQAAEYCQTQNLSVVNDFLTRENVSTLGKFDVVNLCKVLEHIPDPQALINLTRQLLNPQGLICIEVPNDFSPFQLAATHDKTTESWWVAPPHHINYFNLSSLETLLQKTGFEVLSKTTSFPIDLFLLMGDHYIGNDELGKQCHQKVKSFELALANAGFGDLANDFHQKLASLNIGREAIIIAKKI